MAAPTHLSIALWAKSMTPFLNGIGAWAAEVDAELMRARTSGIDLLMLPEWMAAQWLSFAPGDLVGTAEVAWMAEQADAALAAVASAVARSGVALCAGTMPMAIEVAGKIEHRNRSFLILPDGRRFGQDKLTLTPTERDRQGWWIEPGESVEVIEWRGLRLAQ
ncbi:MAG: nitrilase, partial [Alphaproteobacteria bacterium]|nr:nitrilase [Alphaproteobacteria bacterium]